MKKRVVVAMSGGVDSSVAAALLQKQGYEVIGITMCFSAAGANFAGAGRKKPGCCSREGIEDAARVANKLGIRHYVLNLEKELKKWVIEDFCAQYLKGRTPNPCIRCNQFIKFGALLEKAISLDAEYLATGHYVKKSKVTPRLCSGQESQKSKTNGYLLRKAKDKHKDQSYFLYRLNQNQLKHILFPLGNYTKKEVRALAKKFDLPVAEKLASQEICFLPDGDYRGFLQQRLHTCLPAGRDLKPGDIVDKEGNILGRHRGIAYYTIGQREGLGIAKGYPIYITKIDAKKNKIIVGTREDAYKSEFFIKDLHFVFAPIKKKVALRVKIRYNHKEEIAEVMPYGEKMKIKFRKPQFAITPGQSAVFYAKDKILGGGIIDEVLN
jgi:tRNA-specific 2-thiouridylase